MSNYLQGTKTVHATASPFTETEWPLISSRLEFELVNLLLPLLSPVGHHREKRAQSSRNREQGEIQVLALNTKGNDEEEEEVGEKVKASLGHGPDHVRHLTVGFNSTIRTLERLAKYVSSTDESPEAEPPPPSLAAVFVCTESLPNIMTSSLPLLVAIASIKSENEIRLVKISAQSAKRIANALELPRVNALGVLKNDTAAESLMALLQNEIDLVKVPYLDQAVSGTYRPVKIHSEAILSNSKGKSLEQTRVIK